MRIRTQLVLSFLLLSVVPLIAIVAWSYISSSRAVTQAVLEEAEESTRDIEGRLQLARATLLTRFAELGDHTPAGSAGDDDDAAIARQIATQMGDLALTMDSIVVLPAVPPAPAALDQSDGEQRNGDRHAVPPQPPIPPITIDVDSLLSQVEMTERLAPGQAAEINHQLQQSIESARAAAEAVKIGREALEQARRIAREQEREAQAQARMILGHELRRTLADGREIVATVRPEQFLRNVLSAGGTDDIPFAIDSAGNVYTADEDARARLTGVSLQHPGGPGVVTRVEHEWVVATSRDEDTKLTYGIAHPVRESLTRLRRTAGANLGAGLGVIGLALLIIVPIANHLTRDLEDVTDGARRIAAGEIGTEVPVRSRNEVGQLAAAFNQMSHELEEQRQRLIEEESLRREQEISQRLLQADHARKTEELEDARRFQLSLLPRVLPAHPSLEIAVHMQTATEVGGDYYDVLESGDEIVVTVGDATGHGARAGTMVTVVKSLFAAHGDRLQPGAFLEEADRAIRRMELGRMAMALLVARISSKSLTIASAGMPPLLVRRAGGVVEEHLVPGTPLGTLGGSREEKRIPLQAGDTMLFTSDGLAEMTSAEGEPIGYVEVTRELERATVDAGNAAAVVERLRDAVDRRLRGRAPADDITFVVVRRT